MRIIHICVNLFIESGTFVMTVVVAVVVALLWFNVPVGHVETVR